MFWRKLWNSFLSSSSSFYSSVVAVIGAIAAGDDSGCPSPRGILRSHALMRMARPQIGDDAVSSAGQLFTSAEGSRISV
jgi:hypothetical protein